MKQNVKAPIQLQKFYRMFREFMTILSMVRFYYSTMEQEFKFEFSHVFKFRKTNYDEESLGEPV